jgi:hypothetical protein
VFTLFCKNKIYQLINWCQFDISYIVVTDKAVRIITNNGDQLYSWSFLVWICGRRSLLMDVTETRSARVWKIIILCYFSCMSVRNWVEFSQSILTGFQNLISIKHLLSLCTVFIVFHFIMNHIPVLLVYFGNVLLKHSVWTFWYRQNFMCLITIVSYRR